MSELKDLRRLAQDHLAGILTGAVTFEEIDRAKQICLKYGIKPTEKLDKYSGFKSQCSGHEDLESEIARLKAHIAELETVPEIINSMSEGKRLVHMLKSVVEKLRKDNKDLKDLLRQIEDHLESRGPFKGTPEDRLLVAIERALK